ncbi:MAG: hypothetical protein R6V26_00010 [Roseovarius sp.]
MKADFRKIKVSLVFAILLSVVFVAVANINDNTASADNIVYTRVNFELDKEPANNTISPGEVKTWDFTVSYTADPATGGGSFLNKYYRTTLQIEIVEGDKEWITITPSQSTINTKPDDSVKLNVKVSLTVDAPYLESHNIRIRATALGTNLFAEAFAEQTITIVPEFLYFVDANSLSNYAEVTPGETHSFPVNVVNDASYTVKYFFDTQSVPKDWVVSAPDSLTVGPKSKEQVKISVAPPYDFGYYDEIEDFQVKVTAMPFPAAAGYEKQEVDTLNFQVKNRGFSASASGGGILIMVGIIVAVIVILFLVFMILKSDMFKKKR